MKAIKHYTLLFLLKRSGSEVSEVCLAMKKRGFGAGRWNGVGGKVEPGEATDDAARREAHEEVGIEVPHLTKVGELTFVFPHQEGWDQFVQVYTAEHWEGEPTESEEMRPAWFVVEAIPYKEMWPDDIYWLPYVLAGKKVRGSFTFGEGDLILDHAVTVLDSHTEGPVREPITVQG
jgi:8-oxo-dGTP pyrophosphatase MutT (NUDIX family)